MIYFDFIKDFPGEKWPTFNGLATPGCIAPNYFDIFSEFGISRQDFVKKANLLFQEYKVKVPQNYPNLKPMASKIFGSELELNPMNEFATCVGSCILIKDMFNYDVSKIIKNELIAPNSRRGILHADSLATIVLHYLKKGSKVVIPKEVDGRYNPDLIIDNYHCEIKVINESDWTQEIDLETGRGRQRELSQDLCYDIGQFISKKDSGHKGIKQSDIVFADLSFKSFGWIEKITGKHNSGFPNLKKYRIVYFTKKITDISSYYLEFDPLLWELIKTTDAKHSFSVLPWAKTATSK